MLTGDRVTLRAIRQSDYDRLAEFKNDLEAEVLSGGEPPRPRPNQTVAEFFDGLVKDKETVNFAIEADGSIIGDIGLFHIDRISGSAEFGIGIGDRDYWGKGYGREAIGLLVDYGFRHQNLRRIWLETFSSNERAIRCYRAVGFVEEGRSRQHVWSDGQYVDLVHMGLLREEWRGRAAG
jgi:RimJ/RimL family protein N-acetyltransferase